MGNGMTQTKWVTFCSLALIFAAALKVFSQQSEAQSYDLVLANGRVMDPESNFDAVRNVGIRGGRSGAISASPLQGRTAVDAKGLIVTAGFIDLHSHGQTPENYNFKARDGVTTVLEMEVGVNPVAAWYASREGRALVNFGATSGHIPARMAVMHDGGGLLPRDVAANRAASAEERNKTYELVRQGLDEGGLGIGMGIAYTRKRRVRKSWSYFNLPLSGACLSTFTCAIAAPWNPVQLIHYKRCYPTRSRRVHRFMWCMLPAWVCSKLRYCFV